MSDFEMDILGGLARSTGSLRPSQPVLTDEPKKHRRRLKRRAGLFHKVELDWQGSLQKLDVLKQLGYSDLVEYCISPHWEKVCKSYSESCLLQHCMICNNEDFVLRHVDYAQIGQEKIHRLLPLCEFHSYHLDKKLAELTLPVELSFDVLGEFFKLPKTFHRKMFDYRKRLLRHVCSLVGMTFEIVPFHIGNKQSRKRDQKIIYFGKKQVFFNVGTGKVQMGINGACLSFERFCDRLQSYLN